MAIDPCEPCACDPGPLGSDPVSARITALRILCAILAAAEASASCDCVVEDAAFDPESTGSLVGGVNADGSVQFLQFDVAGNLLVAQSPVTSGTATQTLAAPTGVVSTVLAANVNRLGGWVRNIGAGNIYVRFGAGATVLLPTLLQPGDSLLFSVGGPVYTGIVTAITAGGTESLEVTELT